VWLYLILVARDRRDGMRRARANVRDGRERETSFIIFIRTYKINPTGRPREK
jgi:hypothetical protein